MMRLLSSRTFWMKLKISQSKNEDLLKVVKLGSIIHVSFTPIFRWAGISLFLSWGFYVKSKLTVSLQGVQTRFVSSISSVVFLIFLLSFTNANNDLFTDFISNVLVDNQFSDGFFSELLAAKYIFEHDRKYFYLGAKTLNKKNGIFRF